MKKIIYIFLSGLLTFTSCDVLDKEPLDIISDAVVWNDKSLIEAFFNRCYMEMYVFDNESPDINQYGSFQVMYMINNISDECKATETWSDDAYSYKFGNLKIQGGLLEWWEIPYKTVRKLNEFIERVPDSPVGDAAFVKQRVAEARFLRAFEYFSMVKRYGGVPLITSVQNIDDPEDILFPKRNTEQEIYDFVLSEMDAIVTDLPEEYESSDYGRPTKYAALALKCRAALYAASIAQFGTVQLDGLAGINNSLANSYYQKSYDAANQIINSGIYALYNMDEDKTTNFRNVFMVEKNSEAIFVRQHDANSRDAGGNGSNYDFMQSPYPNGWEEGNLDAPYLEMVEEFEHIDGTSGKLDRTAIQQGLWTTEELWANKDPRFFATFYTMNTLWKGSKIDYRYGILTPDGTVVTTGSYNGILARGLNYHRRAAGFGVLKYLDETYNNTDWNSSSKIDWIVFRYAEILLNYAEAAFELEKPNDALEVVNQIRVRAGIALLSNIDRDMIRHERKVELAFEGHRYWDVRRWGIATTVLSLDFSGLLYILDYQTGKYKLMINDKIDGSVSPAFYDQNYYLPITLERTGQNSNLVENPGY